MVDDTLFSLEPEPVPLAEVRVDRAFTTAHRVALDATSWLEHVPGWLHGDRALLEQLLVEESWEQRSRRLYGREVLEPRLTAERPSVSEAPQAAVQRAVEALSQRYERRFTRLWLNHYRDHEDSTGWHWDRPADREPEAVVPVLSLGAARRFLVRPRGGGPSTTLVVAGGDLVVMGGRCQRDFEHCVPKERTPTGSRVSLNFSVT